MSTATPPPPSFPHERPDRTLSVLHHLWGICQPRLVSFFSVFVAGTVLVLLADWTIHWSFIRPWMQISATLIAVLAALVVVGKPELERFERFLLSSLVLILSGAVLDSRDGYQDQIPIMALLLAAYSGIAAHATRTIIRSRHLHRWRRIIGVGVGGATTGVYLSLMVYHLITVQRTEFITLTREPFAAYGFALIAVLNWIGQIYPPAPTLRGNVRRCPQCDLLNIPERRMCKRCGAALGGIERST